MSLKRGFKEIPLWLFLGTLTCAPWAFGSTRPWTIELLDACMAATLFSWALLLAADRRWPRIPRWIALISIYLLLQAWWMTLNAKSILDPDYFRFVSIDAFWPSAPGSVDRPLSLSWTLRTSLILLMSWMACDLSAIWTWRKRIFATIALNGAGIAVLGLIQRLTDADGIFWQDDPRGNLFFATFFYHANAGAFLNITWPQIAAWCLIAFRYRRSILVRNFWIAALAFIAAGLFVNTSRAATFLAVFGGIGYIAWSFVTHFESGSQRWIVRLGSTLIVCAAIVGVALASGLQESVERWFGFSSELKWENSRLVASEVSWSIVPEAGWFGYGPGTFQTVFPFFTKEKGGLVAGRWRFAHQDYLQTLIEWGKAGFLAWALYFLGAVFSAFRHRPLPSDSRTPERVIERDQIFRISSLFGLALVLLHSLVDFPMQIASIELYAATLCGVLYQKDLRTRKA